MDSNTAFAGTISNVPLVAVRVLISASNAAVVTGRDLTSGNVSLIAQGSEVDMMWSGGQWGVIGKRVGSGMVGNGAHAWPTYSDSWVQFRRSDPSGHPACVGSLAGQ